MESVLREIVSQAIEDTDFKFIDMTVSHGRKQDIYRIFLDSENGITVGECQALGRQIGQTLETNEHFTRPFVLEVSSPGIDRPIVEDWQFRKNLGRNVKVEFEDEHQNPQIITARIERVEGDVVVLSSRRKKETDLVSVPLARIKQATVQINFNSKE